MNQMNACGQKFLSDVAYSALAPWLRGSFLLCAWVLLRVKAKPHYLVCIHSALISEHRCFHCCPSRAHPNNFWDCLLSTSWWLLGCRRKLVQEQACSRRSGERPVEQTHSASLGTVYCVTVMLSPKARARECAAEPPPFLTDALGRLPVSPGSLEVLCSRALQTIIPSHLMLELWIEPIFYTGLWVLKKTEFSSNGFFF